ncbi:hypothetical protein OSTOST_24715 [Ostertagia ostertagi]
MNPVALAAVLFVGQVVIGTEESWCIRLPSKKYGDFKDGLKDLLKGQFPEKEFNNEDLVFSFVVTGLKGDRKTTTQISTVILSNQDEQTPTYFTRREGGSENLSISKMKASDFIHKYHSCRGPETSSL